MKFLIGTCALTLALAVAPARGQFLVDTGTPDMTSNASVFYVNPTFGQILAQKFTLAQDATVTKLEIFANGFGLPITVHLANQVGAGATAANVVTTLSISPPHVVGVNNGTWVGQDTNLCLAAGDYWLVFSETSGSSTLPTKPATSVGESLFASQGTGDINIAFPPASLFLTLNASTQFGVRITGTNGAVPGTWASRGFGLAGVAGIPTLTGTGTLVGGSSGSLDLASAAPSRPCVLLVSLAASPLPFKGGTVVAVPPALTISLGTSAGGTLSLPFVWPVGLPSGTSLWFQFLISDLAAVQKVALSDAVLATTP